MKKIVIIYHGDCKDGFGGAWVAWKKFGAKARYLPAQHERPVPRGLKNKKVYLIDFSYPLPKLKTLLKNASKVILIDHHLTAQAAAKLIPEGLFNLNHSGAVLAWKYFYPKKSIPQLLRHIEDRDLWKFKLSSTEEILTALGTRERSFVAFETFMKSLNNSRERSKIIKEGKALLAYKAELVSDILTKASLGVFAGKKVPIVNSPIFESDLGNALVRRGFPFAVVWHYKRDRIKISLRSDGKFDVSKIALRFGGGGHKAAAAFHLPITKPLPWKLLKK